MKKTIIMAAIAIIMTSCVNKENSQQSAQDGVAANEESVRKTFVKPQDYGFDINNLMDCTVDADFTVDDFNWEKGTIKLTVYGRSLYDAVEINCMKVGDSILYDNKTIIIKDIADMDGWIDVNGGFEEGGCTFEPLEGGTYIATTADDFPLFVELGKVDVPILDDFIIEDCGVESTDPVTNVKSGQKAYLDGLEDYRKEFSYIDTKVNITGGKVSKIVRIYVP